MKAELITTNVSSQINYYQNKDINYNNKYNQEIKVPAFNIYINETKKFNNFLGRVISISNINVTLSPLGEHSFFRKFQGGGFYS